MAQMRVAQVMGKMIGGGIEAVVMNYYRHIDRDAVQFDFVVDEDSTLVPYDEIRSLGGRVFLVPPYQRQPRNSLELERLFRRESWRIVHSHMNTLSVFPLRAARRAGVPVRVAHSHSTWGRGELVRNAIKAVLRTQANRYPTHRMACGTYAGKWLFGRRIDFTVLNNAVDMERFTYSGKRRSEVRNELGISDDAFVVGHAGRFVTQKNHEKLVDVFSEVRASCPVAVLVLAGEGPLASRIRERVHVEGLSESVRFLGQRRDAHALYSAFDCLCLPSLYEGLPVVSVEAQMAGLPLVMSNAVSSEACITSKCTVVPLEADAGTWAEVVLACRGASRDLSVSDRRSLEPYSIENATGKLLAFYEAAISEEGE